jgi:hypothetical protein
MRRKELGVKVKKMDKREERGLTKPWAGVTVTKRV